MNSPIPCLILAYGEPNILEQSVESIVKTPGLSLRVIHNPSTEEQDARIFNFARSQLAIGSISEYSQFYDNISNNAVTSYIINSRDNLSDSEYIIVSDGDVIVPQGTLQEQIDILSDNSDVFACGMRIDVDRWTNNLSVKAIVKASFEAGTKPDKRYTHAATGVWFVLFRTREFFAIFDLLIENGRRFTDGNLKSFAYITLRKKWVATLKHIGRELNRERSQYHEIKEMVVPEFARFSPEITGSKYSIWNHDKTSKSRRHLRGGSIEYSAITLSKAVPRHRTSLGDDATVRRMVSEPWQPLQGFLGHRPPQPASPPGLYFVLQDGLNPNGIPYLGERAIIYLGRDLDVSPIRRLKMLQVGGFLETESPEIGMRVLSTAASFLDRDGVIQGWIHAADGTTVSRWTESDLLRTLSAKGWAVSLLPTKNQRVPFRAAVG